MPKRKQLLTVEDAVPAKSQHTSPCSDCPWARAALKGWLGDLTADEWLQQAHGEGRLDCHTLAGAQCAGAAIYRKNICKLPRDKKLLLLPADREQVFSGPYEFKAHHETE